MLTFVVVFFSNTHPEMQVIDNLNFRWPQACAEIITYRIPQRNFEITKKTSTLSIEIQRQQLNQTERNGEGNERTIAISLILSLFINFVFV